MGPDMYRSRACLALALALATFGCSGCLGFAHHDRERPLPPCAEEAGLRRLTLLAGHYMGLSDLAVQEDAEGKSHLWVLPERQRALLELMPPRGPGAPQAAAQGAEPHELLQVLLAERIRLEGIPPYLDTEALAALGPNRFVLGTEAPWADRIQDDLLVVEVGPEKSARVVDKRVFPYAPFGLKAERNAGIEGLCAAGNWLLAASETTGRLPDGARFAPLGLWQGDTFWPLRLRLASETGRISALTCRLHGANVGRAAGADAVPTAEPAALEVLAIERNYGVANLLRFMVPLERARADEGTRTATALRPAAAVLAPTRVLQLTPLLVPLRNYEGIAWLAGGDVLLVSDNSMGFATGPSEALLVPQALLSGEVTCP